MAAIPLKGLTLTAAYGHLTPKYLDVGLVRGLALDSKFQRTPRHSFSGSVNYEVPFRSGMLSCTAITATDQRNSYEISRQ